ncbi:hypothetical protein DH2020_041055 [Rehmannia glutinosa]|uniref:Uncharacterized protein n=1 Tax=Rehmannia glutinosa TaxID=99300 RepID=A0ABR0USC5_REHGL
MDKFVTDLQKLFGSPRKTPSPSPTKSNTPPPSPEKHNPLPEKPTSTQATESSKQTSPMATTDDSSPKFPPPAPNVKESVPTDVSAPATTSNPSSEQEQGNLAVVEYAKPPSPVHVIVPGEEGNAINVEDTPDFTIIQDIHGPIGRPAGSQPGGDDFEVPSSSIAHSTDSDGEDTTQFVVSHRRTQPHHKVVLSDEDEPDKETSPFDDDAPLAQVLVDIIANLGVKAGAGTSKQTPVVETVEPTPPENDTDVSESASENDEESGGTPEPTSDSEYDLSEVYSEFFYSVDAADRYQVFKVLRHGESSSASGVLPFPSTIYLFLCSQGFDKLPNESFTMLPEMIFVSPKLMDRNKRVVDMSLYFSDDEPAAQADVHPNVIPDVMPSVPNISVDTAANPSSAGSSPLSLDFMQGQITFADQQILFAQQTISTAQTTILNAQKQLGYYVAYKAQFEDLLSKLSGQKGEETSNVLAENVIPSTQAGGADAAAGDPGASTSSAPEDAHIEGEM